ncbi:MAG: hypothetical protein RLY86_3286 [Pseudomonadota bacterium]|jgi:hypothetical protein
MAETADLLIRIEASTALLQDELRKTEATISKFARNADRNAKATEAGMTAAFGKIGSAAAGLAAGFVSLGAAMSFGQAVIRATAEGQKLEASLRTVTGSAQAATIAFARLQEFAAQTPFSLQEVTQAFIRLKALGLDPSEAALRSYANTASAMGGSLTDVIEAVADATTGEFERLKSFGIRASSEGDRVTFTFREVATQVGKNATEIEDYLRRIGDVQFANATTLQAATLGGAISNLEDNYQSLLRTLGASAPIIETTQALSDLVAIMNLAAEGYLDFEQRSVARLEHDLERMSERAAFLREAIADGGVRAFILGTDRMREELAGLERFIAAIEARVALLRAPETGGDRPAPPAPTRLEPIDLEELLPAETIQRIKEVRQMLEDGEAATRRYRTEVEVFADEQARLAELLGAGAIGLETYTRAMKALDPATREATAAQQTLTRWFDASLSEIDRLASEWVALEGAIQTLTAAYADNAAALAEIQRQATGARAALGDMRINAELDRLFADRPDLFGTGDAALDDELQKSAARADSYPDDPALVAAMMEVLP